MSEPAQEPMFVNRELSWLSFARRVLALVEDETLPLLERLKFAAISGMLQDEFFMKRISGLKRQVRNESKKLSLDGRTPDQEFEACRAELALQDDLLARAMSGSILPALAREGQPILDWTDLPAARREQLRRYFQQSVQPILTPLAVDAEHPFPFISGMSLNLAVTLPVTREEAGRFVRIKVPDNRPRWVPLGEGAGGGGFVPLEQVIAANLDLMFPGRPPLAVYTFRVVRGASGSTAAVEELTQEDDYRAPGRILDVVANELKARRFAGVVRLQVDPAMPSELADWLTRQLGAERVDVYRSPTFLGLSDLMRLEIAERADLRWPAHTPKTHPRLRRLEDRTSAIFEEIARGDILLHHPYHSFDTSVLRFLESAAADPHVLAIKLTIYRTGSDSPIVRALADAARRGKQVAVLVEITARFDEAPNIAWGQYLEKEGVHVAYGVERLKTHVKLALVVREEDGQVRRYAHVGTGNYHIGTARVYEDLGLLTCHAEICEEVAAVFNSLTGAHPSVAYRRMLVAPQNMRERFTALIRREQDHAREGRPAGIRAKMNQLQDPAVIRELYAASRAGVPLALNVRGLCCLRPGVPGLSEGIRVYGLVGRFLEHSRIYRFENGGAPEYYIGSADWMKRNLDGRVETIVPILDPAIQCEIDAILAIYERDNCSVWDCGPDGAYVRRRPAAGEPPTAAQDVLSGIAPDPGRAEPLRAADTAAGAA